MKSIFVLLACMISVFQCQSHYPNITSKTSAINADIPEASEPASYYSDYFVFVAADEPLVIPFDFNWSPSEKGYNREFKAWYGTEKEWPILYIKDDKKSKSIPNDPWEHENVGGFAFDKGARTITIDIQSAPRLTLQIPEKSEWIPMEHQSDNKKIFTFKTSVVRNGKVVEGWMIYEQIRWDAESLNSFGDFTAFYWVPLVIDGDFYHFELHKGRGKGIASKWYVQDNKVKTEVTDHFSLDILEIEADKKSGRKEIPKTLRLQAKKWDLDISLKSEGAQVGYGQEFPKGLAYYRQSILINTPSSKSQGYGMLELILENN